MSLSQHDIDRVADLALNEDLAGGIDVTTESTVWGLLQHGKTA